MAYKYSVVCKPKRKAQKKISIHTKMKPAIAKAKSVTRRKGEFCSVWNESKRKRVYSTELL